MKLRRLNEEELEYISELFPTGFSFNEKQREMIIAFEGGGIWDHPQIHAEFSCGWIRISDWVSCQSQKPEYGCLFYRMTDISPAEFRDLRIDTQRVGDFELHRHGQDGNRFDVDLHFIQPPGLTVYFKFYGCHWEAVFFEEPEGLHAERDC